MITKPNTITKFRFDFTFTVRKSTKRWLEFLFATAKVFLRFKGEENCKFSALVPRWRLGLRHDRGLAAEGLRREVLALLLREVAHHLAPCMTGGRTSAPDTAWTPNSAYSSKTVVVPL